MPPKEVGPQTITIDNFSGKLTRYKDGSINSGFAKYATTHSCDMITSPGNLTFMDLPIPLETNGIDTLVLAGKERKEGGFLYVYAIGNTGKLYKIQVNSPPDKNPDYDTATVIATLSAGSPTFDKGASMEFYEDVILIGHDVGVTQIGFNGSGEAQIGTSWTPNVPRPMKQFLGNVQVGNGNDIAEINSGLIVSDYTRLSPAFPSDYQVQDLDVTADGVYLVIVVAQIFLNDITDIDPDYNQIESTNSVIAYWNGTDDGYTTSISMPSVNLTAYKTFGQSQYSFGYDMFGAALFSPSEKNLTLPQMQSPFFNAKASLGGAVMWGVPEYDGSRLLSTIHYYGQLDAEIPAGHYRIARVNFPILSGGNSMKVPFILPVSNNIYGASFNQYSNNIFGFGKIYFSAIESDGTNTSYTFYMLHVFPNGLYSAAPGVYETQNQLFSKRQVVKQVRIYLNPVSAAQSFQLDLIGIDGLPMIGCTKIFTAGDGVTLGDTMAQFDPSMQPTASIGVRITNINTETPIISKIELDIEPQGK